MRIIIVGAGIMGLTTAWALTKRGHHVTVVEQAATIPSVMVPAWAEEVAHLVQAFAPPLARIADYRVREAVTCVYTFTEDKTFFARRTGKLLAVSACSGHAYKFGAAVGRQVADGIESQDVDGLQRWLRAEAA